MQVTDFTIGAAVLTIFRDFRVFHRGGSLLVEDLRAAWPRTGFRSGDFEPAMDWVVREKWIERCWIARPGVEVATLTQLGADRITRFPPVRRWVPEVQIYIALLEAARRPRRRSRRNPAAKPALPGGQEHPAGH